jgi:hypothetical protein
VKYIEVLLADGDFLDLCVSIKVSHSFLAHEYAQKGIDHRVIGRVAYIRKSDFDAETKPK